MIVVGGPRSACRPSPAKPKISWTVKARIHPLHPEPRPGIARKIEMRIRSRIRALSLPSVRAMTLGAALSCSVGIVATAHASAAMDVVPPDSGDGSNETPDQPKASGTEDTQKTGGPSLGAIVAACVGVLFGVVVARWQIKRFQQMKQ